MILASSAKERSHSGVLAEIDELFDIHGMDGPSEETGCRSLASDEDGQTMAEYAVILATVALLASAAFLAFGQAIVSMFGPIVDAVTS